MMLRRMPDFLPCRCFYAEPNELEVVIFSFRGRRQALFRNKNLLLDDSLSRIDVRQFGKLGDPMPSL